MSQCSDPARWHRRFATVIEFFCADVGHDTPLLLHPALKFKPLHTAEIFDVVADDDGVDASRVRSDHQVVSTDELALLFWSARISA